MADKVLIEPLVLDPADFPPLPLTPGFVQLVNDELADQGTPTDGFDAVMADAQGIVDALDSVLTSLGADLVDTFAEADLIDPAPVSATADGFSAAAAAGSAAVLRLGNAVNPPAPTPQPAPGPAPASTPGPAPRTPPSGGGGAGGSGGGFGGAGGGGEPGGIVIQRE